MRISSSSVASPPVNIEQNTGELETNMYLWAFRVSEYNNNNFTYSNTTMSLGKKVNQFFILEPGHSFTKPPLDRTSLT